ncbi:hypothetical protein TrST_g9299 [Triparma strigata]|uniref:Uncharacterized protein n=1 Tax=Triparma strigata TaxID=1606541 RepID=A0A9W7EYV4_9STRA|nr:hypothetical protein TrST_g9299 [Triparma strigata]
MASPSAIQASCKFVKVNHNNTSHFVALFTGLPSSELAGVLGAAFSVPPSSIIGLLDSQTGFVIPLSLASLSPETLNGEGHSYSLLLQQSTAIANLPPSAPERDVVSTDMYNASFAPPSAPPPVYEPANQTRGNQVYWNEEETPASSSVGAVAPSVSSDIDADLIRILTAFVSKLCAHESLTTREATIITSLIGQSDSVILSAYKVAEWTQSATYFQRALTSIAANLSTTTEEHTRMSYLIDIANVLFYDSEEINEEEYVALLDSVLRMDPILLTVSQAYQLEDDVDELTESLRQIAVDMLTPIPQKPINQPSNQQQQPQQVADDSNIDVVTLITFVANSLASSNLIPPAAVNYLTNLAREGDEFIVGAWEKYAEDGDVGDLRDTVLRFVRSLVKRGEEEESEEEEEEESEEEEEESEEEEEESEEEEEETLTVPTGFQNAILLLLKHNRITKEAATALLTAMAQGNQVLRTIYKAFTVNRDANAFLDMIQHLVSGTKESPAPEASPEPEPAAQPPTETPEQSKELQDRFDAVFEQCLQILLAREMVTREGAKALILYSRNNMPELMSLLEKFNGSGDLDSLLGDLKQIATSELASEPSAPEPQQQQPSQQQPSEPNTDELDAQLIKVLAQCIDVMLTRKQIGVEGAKALLEMAKAKAPILLAELSKAFDSNLDLEELLNTLSSLANGEVEVRKAEESQTKESEETEGEPAAALEQELSNGLTRVLTQVIEILKSNNVIDDEGSRALLFLGEIKSPVLMQALSVFHESNDLEQLFETLHMLATEGAKMMKAEGMGNLLQGQAPGSPPGTFASDDDDEEEEDEEEDEGKDSSDYDTSEGENDKVQPMTWVERRRSLSLESMGDLASDAAAMSSQAGQSYQNDDDDEVDEDDDDLLDGSTLEMLTHPSTLSHLIVMLHDAGLASVAERAVLLNLAEAGDPRCLAAFDVYRDMLTAIEGDDSKDERELDELRETALDDLVDTCMRICKRELRQGPYDRRHSSFAMTDEGVVQLNPDDSNAEGDEGGMAREEKDEEDGIELRTFSESFDATADPSDGLVGAGPGHKEGGKPENDSVFSDSDRLEVVHMMVANNVLSEDEGIILELLVEKKNRHVELAFKNYEANKDVVDLTVAMKKIAQTAGDYLVSQGLPPAAEEEEEEEEEEEVNEEKAPVDPEQAAYEVFYSHVEMMDLGDIETAALRLCIAKGDPTLKAALEAFRITDNGVDLQDTLRKIIRNTIEGVDVQERVNSVRQKEQAQREVAVETSQPPQADGADAEKFTDMERRYIITMLISELSKQGIITAVQGSDLLAKFNAGDEEVTTALDKYEEERSMENFVGTLKAVSDRG